MAFAAFDAVFMLRMLCGEEAEIFHAIFLAFFPVGGWIVGCKVGGLKGEAFWGLYFFVFLSLVNLMIVSSSLVSELCEALNIQTFSIPVQRRLSQDEALVVDGQKVAV